MEIYFCTHEAEKKVAGLLFDKRKQFVLLTLYALEARVCRLKVMDIDEGVNYLFDRKCIIKGKGWKIRIIKIFLKIFF